MVIRNRLLLINAGAQADASLFLINTASFDINVMRGGKDAAGRDEGLVNAALVDTRAAGIARTFQNLRLFAERTALDNVLIGYF